MKHIAFALLAASLYAQTPQPLRDPYQDYRHLGEFDLRSAKTVRPKVVLLTPADDSVCLTPYEEVYSWTGGTKHICQPTTYSAATGTWQTISGSGAAEPAASSLAVIDDFRTVRTSSTVLTINPDAATNRVVGGVGDTPYAFTAPATVTVSGSGASGTVYIAQRDDGVITHTHNSIACTFAESGVTEVTGTTYTGKAIATATVTNCLWDASGVTDQRSFFGQGKKITVGSGLTKTETATAIELSASGGASVAGSDTQVQYNNSGALGASSNFIFTSAVLRIISRNFIVDKGKHVNMNGDAAASTLATADGAGVADNPSWLAARQNVFTFSVFGSGTGTDQGGWAFLDRQSGTVRAFISGGSTQGGMGIGTVTPLASTMLDVVGTTRSTLLMFGAGSEATCNSTNRGVVAMVQGGGGVADTLRVCRKDASDVYAWTALY